MLVRTLTTCKQLVLVKRHDVWNMETKVSIELMNLHPKQKQEHVTKNLIRLVKLYQASTNVRCLLAKIGRIWPEYRELD